jgi:hypothetical protein
MVNIGKKHDVCENVNYTIGISCGGPAPWGNRLFRLFHIAIHSNKPIYLGYYNRKTGETGMALKSNSQVACGYYPKKSAQLGVGDFHYKIDNFVPIPATEGAKLYKIVFSELETPFIKLLLGSDGKIKVEKDHFAHPKDLQQIVFGNQPKYTGKGTCRAIKTSETKRGSVETIQKGEDKDVCRYLQDEPRFNSVIALHEYILKRFIYYWDTTAQEWRFMSGAKTDDDVKMEEGGRRTRKRRGGRKIGLWGNRIKKYMKKLKRRRRRKRTKKRRKHTKKKRRRRRRRTRR